MKDIFKVAMLQMERSSDINNNIKKGREEKLLKYEKEYRDIIYKR